ncbi:MAG: hypothetical protein JNK05_33720 [Myxococcales bacterium]|nr:hypothetical protein [Myxococcales bacterium]
MNEPRRWLDSSDSDHAQHRSVLAHGKRHPNRPLDTATRRRMRQRVAALSATAVGASVFVGWLKALAAGLGLSAVVAGATVATLVARDALRANANATTTPRPQRAASRAPRVATASPQPAPHELPRVVAEAPTPVAAAAPSPVATAPSLQIARRNTRVATRAIDPSPAIVVASASPMQAGSTGPSLPSPQPVASASSPEVAPSSAADALTRERLMLEPARAALARDPTAALAAIDHYQRAFERGQLLAESEYIAIEALRRSGRGAQADARADALVRRFPSSVYATLLRRQRGER